jgi:hypothetical protein
LLTCFCRHRTSCNAELARSWTSRSALDTNCGKFSAIRSHSCNMNHYNTVPCDKSINNNKYLTKSNTIVGLLSPTATLWIKIWQTM